MKKLISNSLMLAGVFVVVTATIATATEQDHSKMDHSKGGHSGMDHSQHMTQGQGNSFLDARNAAKQRATMPSSKTPLTEAGNAIFGTIQEAIKHLDANPNTDWSKVDLEGLRQHLIDMDNFTTHADVLSSKEIEKGLVIVVKATTDSAQLSLTRAFKDHPKMLKQESGWDMLAKAEGDTFILTIETSKPEEVARLRGLGYIGVMAIGDHHQIHHWGMASGNNPHQHAH